MAASGFLVLEDKPRVLVVDDERFIREILADFLAMEGFEVALAEDGRIALDELRRGAFDVVLTDLKMPNLGGLELLEHINREFPKTLTIIMTGFGTVETAIEAMKRGAHDYVLKPFRADEIVQVVQRAIHQNRLKAENLRLREAVSLYKVSEAISASLSLDEVVNTVANSTLQDVHADVSIIWLDDGAGGFSERDVRRAPHWSSENTITPDDPAIRERLSTERGVVEHGQRAMALFTTSAEPVQSVAVVPMITRERLFGWVGALSLTQGKRFDEGQRKLLTMLASRAAAAIDNARLYENLQATFRQTIESLARTIDKMDHYTSGHSERVARYASRLARSLGMDEAQIEVVRQAALMHDIGKVGCVMNLNNPNRLTQDEYEVFKRHPNYGKDILDPIRFLEPVVPGVFLHHERWDGRGYPLGLQGNGIPLIARVISIADTYDAMTSDRAYRRALPHEVTLDELCSCAGTQFDPDVTGVFSEGIEAWLEEWKSAGLSTPD
jgi:putative nucleotidyltransferase with HDIG domain